MGSKTWFGIPEEEAQELQKLNGKFVAILVRDGKTNDPRLIRENGDSGNILADEDPIVVQARVAELFPNLMPNAGGHKIQYRYIPEKLHLSAPLESHH